MHFNYDFCQCALFYLLWFQWKWCMQYAVYFILFVCDKCVFVSPLKVWRNLKVWIMWQIISLLLSTWESSSLEPISSNGVWLTSLFWSIKSNQDVRDHQFLRILKKKNMRYWPQFVICPSLSHIF